MKSTWIWHYGDYEIYHNRETHLRREEQGYMRPAFWKLSSPYPSVKFIKSFECTGGYMTTYINGNGCVTIDGKRYKSGTRIELSAGHHDVEIPVSKGDGLPAIFVDSNVCPSDRTWKCNHFAGEFYNVGTLDYFDTPTKNPEIFPFSYERKYPIAKKEVEDGIICDFGVELFGYLNIEDLTTQKIGVYYGESEEEALDTEYTYLIDEVEGSNSYRLRQRAFRYIYLKGIKSAKVSCDYEYLPLEKVGSFTSSDELFNDIYKLSSYTFHLNCREGFFDGIKRDRWIWSGDAYQSQRINRYLFFDKEIEQRTLLGLIGKEPIEQHINTILDYSFLWIIGLYEHYFTYGDVEFVKRILPMANRLMDFCSTRTNADGFIEGKYDDWTFIDWSDMDKTGAISSEQILAIKAYEVMHQLNAVCGYETEYKDRAKELKSLVNKYYWDNEQGAFIDSYKSGLKKVTRHANIFAVMYDIADDTQKESILNNVLKNDDITKITTPYFKGYELDVLSKLGEFGEVEKVLRSYWGDMIKLGATTVWEEYDPTKKGIEHYEMYGGKYEKSLCHAWGAGPIYLFGRYYLGVRPTLPGYETFVVEPNLGGLKKIDGTVPIVDGTVTVKLDQDGLKVTTAKQGGTLIWRGVHYDLQPNKTIEIKN